MGGLDGQLPWSMQVMCALGCVQFIVHRLRPWPATNAAPQAAIALTERNFAAMELPPEFTLEDIELQVCGLACATQLGAVGTAGPVMQPTKAGTMRCHVPCRLLLPAMPYGGPVGAFGCLQFCTTVPHAGPPVHLVQGSAASYEWDELADLVRELWVGLGCHCHCFAVCRCRHSAHLSGRSLTLPRVETHRLACESTCCIRDTKLCCCCR